MSHRQYEPGISVIFFRENRETRGNFKSLQKCLILFLILSRLYLACRTNAVKPVTVQDF